MTANESGCVSAVVTTLNSLSEVFADSLPGVKLLEETNFELDIQGLSKILVLETNFPTILKGVKVYIISLFYDELKHEEVLHLNLVAMKHILATVYSNLMQISFCQELS